METLNTDSPWLEAHNLVLAYEGRNVTPEPMNFVLARAGITVLVGKNGAGKSTLLKAVLGERVRKQGDIRLFGESADGFQALAYVPQEPVFSSHLMLEDTLHMAFLRELGWFGRRTQAHAQKVEEAIARFDLGRLRGRTLGQMSPGERQRVLLVRALLQNPKALLLDEPTNHLDPEAKYFFWAALREAVALEDCRVLVSTHDLGFAEKRADWICALHTGRVVYNGQGNRFWTLENIAEVFGEGPARDWMKR